MRVYVRRCTSASCTYVAEFDGSSCGVANWSNERLFCEEVFRDHLHTFFRQQQQTVNSTWEHIRQLYECGGFDRGQFVSRKLFT